MTEDNQISEFEKSPDDQLAFSRIKAEIELIAKKQADSRITDVKEEAKSIINSAKSEAERIKSEIVSRASSEANNNRVREVSRRKLALKMEYLDTREQMIEEIQLEAKSKLQKYTQSDKYSEFLANLVKFSAMSIGGGVLNLYLRSEDKSLLTSDLLKTIGKEISKETGTDSKITVVKEDMKSLGGLKMERFDKKIFVDNSFEARLERSEEEIRIALVGLLS